MPCNHKFIRDLNIDYADWQPTTLIVGTFNPEWPDNNSANWFYGRTENNYFWSVLPKLYSEQSLLCASVDEWEIFCRKHRIAITDLIETIRTADIKNEEHRKVLSSFSDKGIENNFTIDDISRVEIIEILKRTPCINTVFLTRRTYPGLWGKLWFPIKKYCDQNKILCRTLLTPSGNAFYQYNKEERGKYAQLSDFIASKWQMEWGSLFTSRL